MSETCADCGATISEFPAGSGRWATSTIGPGSGTTFEFCCRVTYDTSDGGPYRVVSADYHHPAGKDQRHFKASVA